MLPRSDRVEIAWREKEGYSPVQLRRGVLDPTDNSLPPARQRITQTPEPYRPKFLDEREIMRATYQGDDRCQLACPGCYAAPRVAVSPRDAERAGIRKVAPDEDFIAHMEALGPGMQDFYLIGAEPTMDPAGSARKLRFAHDRGWPQMACTHGAVTTDRFEETFGQAIDAGGLYTVNISLDSMVPEINNQLRGRDYAHERSVAVIRHCVERGVNVKVQMTVWPQSYHTIVDSVEELFAIGVRAFSFHSGSLEGSKDPDREGLVCVDPLAWRVLVNELYRFRDAHHEDLWMMNIPLIYFTEAELRRYVIGDDELTDAFLDHVRRVEEGMPSAKPVHACPALDVPQVYVYGNDGKHGRGAISICQIHNPPGADAFAEYDPGARRFVVIEDPRRNQMQAMIDSPHLCPAVPYATRDASDRVPTEEGDLFQACRFIASNQIPHMKGQFREGLYADAVAYCQAVAEALRLFPRDPHDLPAQRIRRGTMGVRKLADRTRLLRAELETIRA